MKKFLLVILVIVLVIVLGFGVKILLDRSKESEINNEPTVEDYLEKGWEIEAEYNYSGNISENELQDIQENTEEIEEGEESEEIF